MPIIRTLVGYDKQTGEPVYRITRTNSLMSYFQTDAGRVCRISQIITTAEEEKFLGNNFSGTKRILYSNLPHSTAMIGLSTHISEDETNVPTATLRAALAVADGSALLWNHDIYQFTLSGDYDGDATHPGSFMDHTGGKLSNAGYAYRELFTEPTDHSTYYQGYYFLAGRVLKDLADGTSSLRSYRDLLIGREGLEWEAVALDFGIRTPHMTAGDVTSMQTHLTSVSNWWKINAPNTALVLVTPPPLRSPYEVEDADGWDLTNISVATADTTRYHGFCTWLTDTWAALNPTQNKVCNLFDTLAWGTDETDCTYMDGSEVAVRTNHTYYLNETYASGTGHGLNTTGLNAAQTALVNVLAPALAPPTISSVTGTFVNGTTHCVTGANFDASDSVYLGNVMDYSSCTTIIDQTISSSDVTSEEHSHWFTLDKGGFATPVGKYLFVQNSAGVNTAGYLLTTYRYDPVVPAEPEP